MNVLIIHFLSKFDQNILVFKKFAKIFSLWFIWIFFYDVCWSNFSLVNNKNNNLIWVEIIFYFWFCIYNKACKSIIVCVNCMFFDFLQTLAWFCSCWMNLIAIQTAAEFFFIFDWTLIIFMIYSHTKSAFSDESAYFDCVTVLLILIAVNNQIILMKYFYIMKHFLQNKFFLNESICLSKNCHVYN